MVQLKVNGAIPNSPELRQHIEENLGEIEVALPKNSQLWVHVRMASKRVFAAAFRIRVLGRMLVVTAQDENVFQAINRARRQILRQLESVRSQHRNRDRSRLRRSHENALGFRHLMTLRP